MFVIELKKKKDYNLTTLFFVVENIKYFNTYKKRWEKVLKKLISTLEYTAQTLNFYNSHSFSNMELTYYFFFENIKYFNANTHNNRL